MKVSDLFMVFLMAHPLEFRLKSHLRGFLIHNGINTKSPEFQQGEIFEAQGFIRDIATTNPDGNVIEIVQYLRDPLKKVN